jgi:hypothetical protein
MILHRAVSGWADIELSSTRLQAVGVPIVDQV